MKKLETDNLVSPVFERKGPASRIPKLVSLIRAELNTIIKRELEFPLGAIVTITKIEIDTELAQAKVGVSILPFAKSETIFVIVERAAGHVQRLLNARLKVYRVPRLNFYLDTEPEKADRIEHLLDSIKE